MEKLWSYFTFFKENYRFVHPVDHLICSTTQDVPIKFYTPINDRTYNDYTLKTILNFPFIFDSEYLPNDCILHLMPYKKYIPLFISR